METPEYDRDDLRARVREALLAVGLDPRRYEMVAQLPLSGAARDGFSGQAVDLGPHVALLVRHDVDDGMPYPCGDDGLQRPDPPEALASATVLSVGFPDGAPPLIWDLV